MSRHISAGIDVGTYNTRVVVSEFIKGSQYPRIVGTGSGESKGLRHGYITNIDESAKGIKRAVFEAEKISGVKIKRASISIGGISLSSEISFGKTTITRADYEVTHLDVNKAISESEKKLQIINKKILHAIPISYKLDGKEILGKPEGMKGFNLEVKTLFITCLEQHLDDLVSAVTNAGVEVTDVFASPIALGIISLTDKQKIAGCILVDIGAETVSIAVFENGNIVSMHVFSIGSTDITHDIALGLKIPLEEAESLKTENVVHEYPRKKLDQIIEARLHDIFELIDNHLKKIRRSGLLPAGVIITGGGSKIATIEEISIQMLKLPTRVLAIEAMPLFKNKIKDISWITAIGLCIAGQSNNTNGNETLRGISIKRSFYWLKNAIENIGKQMLP